jgi:ribosome-binding ATPase YchF (GTP1/OBG family)
MSPTIQMTHDKSDGDIKLESITKQYIDLMDSYSSLKIEHERAEVDNKSTIDFLNQELEHYKAAYEEAKEQLKKLQRSKENESKDTVITGII